MLASSVKFRFVYIEDLSENIRRNILQRYEYTTAFTNQYEETSQAYTRGKTTDIFLITLKWECRGCLAKAKQRIAKARLVNIAIAPQMEQLMHSSIAIILKITHERAW